MNKDNKKKVAGGAAVATAAAGAIVTGATSALAQDNNSVEAVAEGTPITEGETILEGQILPEVVVPGTAPTKDGGELPEFTATGHAHTAQSQEPAAAHQHAPTAGHQTAETEQPVAQHGSLMEDNKPGDTTEVPQNDFDEEQQNIYEEDYTQEEPYPSIPIDPDERGSDPLSYGNRQEHLSDYEPNAYDCLN